MTFWRDSREPPIATVFFSLRISLQKSLMYYLPGNHHLDRGYWPLQTKTYPVKRELKSSQIEVGLQDSCTMYTYMFDAVPMFSRSWIPFSCTGRLSASIDILRFSQKNCIQFILDCSTSKLSWMSYASISLWKTTGSLYKRINFISFV